MSSGPGQGGIGTIGVLPNGLLNGNFLPTSANNGLTCFELALVQQNAQQQANAQQNAAQQQAAENQQQQVNNTIENLQITAQQVQLQSFLNETLSREFTQPTQNQMVRKKIWTHICDISSIEKKRFGTAYAHKYPVFI